MPKGKKTTTVSFKITTIEQVAKILRKYLMDEPRLNKLLDRSALDKNRLILAINMTIDDFNTSPPPISEYVTFATFPSLTLLLKGSAIECMRMEGIWRVRNKLPYIDGGQQVDVHAEKAQELIQLMRFYQDEYEQKRDKLKMSININFHGSVPSEYYLHYFDTIPDYTA